MARDPGTGAHYKPRRKPPRAPQGEHAGAKPAIHDLIVQPSSERTPAPRTPPAAQGEHARTHRTATAPIVTEHTRGQAGPSPHLAEYRRMEQIRDRGLFNALAARQQGTNWTVGRNPVASLGLDADALLRLLGSTDQLQAPARPGEPQQQSFAPADLAARQVGKSLAQDVTDPLHHKLNFALDAAALLSGGATLAGKGVQISRAARLAETGEKTRASLAALHTPLEPADVLPKRLLPDQSGLRKIRVEGGEVQVPTQSRNVLTAAGQHALDRLTEKTPDLPGLGAKARAARHLTAENQTRGMRLTAQAMPLEEAARKLRSHRGVTPREMAYTVIADYGHTGQEGARLLDTEIALRQGQIAKAAGKAKARLEDRVRLLQAARGHVLKPDADLKAAVAEGQKLSETVTASRVGRGAMTAETAASSPLRHGRITHGAEFMYARDAQREARGVKRKIRALDAEQARVRRKIKLTAKRATATTEARAESKAANVAAEQASRARATLADATAKAQARVKRAEDSLTFEQVRVAEGKGSRRTVVQRTGAVRDARKALADAQRAERDARRAAKPLPAIQQRAAAKTAEQARAAGVLQQRALAAHSDRLGQIARARKKAADRLAQLDTEKNTLVGGENFTPGPQAFYNPDIERRTTGQRAKTSMRGAVGLNPPREKIHQSEGILFRQARNRVGPEPTLRAFQQEVRHLDRQARHERGLELSSGWYDPGTFDSRKQTLIAVKNPVSKRAAAERRQAEAVPQDIDIDEALSPREMVQRFVDEHTAWHDKVFPKAENVSQTDTGNFRVLDKKLADAISGADVVQRMQSGLLGRAFDFTNDLNRLGLIYANPVSYALVQGTGNALFLGLHQGIFTPTNAAKYGRVLSRLDRETRRRIDMSVGGGPARHLAHERGHAVSLQSLANFDNMLADLLPRRLAWLHEAHLKGYNTPAELKALLTDSKLEPQLNVVEDRAQQAMVKFRRNPTKTRQVVGRAIFIAPWLEGSTRYLGRLALDRPITARVANEIRDRISEKQVEKFGKTGKQVTGGFIPVGKAFKKAGIPVIPGWNPDSLSPVGSGIGVIKTVGEVPGLVQHPLHGGTRLAGSFQPTLAAGLTAATRYDPYSGYTYPANRSSLSILREQLIGDTSHPVFPLAATAKTALQKPTPPTGKEHYAPEAGPLDALKRAAFGSARERLVEQPYVTAQTRKVERGSMSPVQRARRDGHELANTLLVGARHHGLIGPREQLPAEVTRAIRLRTLRYANYAKTGAKSQADKFKADVAQLVGRGQIDKAHGDEALAWLAAGPSKRAIEHQRDLIGAQYYGTDVISGARRQIHEAQDAGH